MQRQSDPITRDSVSDLVLEIQREHGIVEGLRKGALHDIVKLYYEIGSDAAVLVMLCEQTTNNQDSLSHEEHRGTSALGANQLQITCEPLQFLVVEKGTESSFSKQRKA